MIKCHCGASAESPGGFVREEAQATGFYPVFTYLSDVRWFCPEHTRQITAAVSALRAACGGDIDGLVPPMMRDLR